MSLCDLLWSNQRCDRGPWLVHDGEQLIKQIRVALRPSENKKQTLPKQCQNTDVQQQLRGVQKKQQRKSPFIKDATQGLWDVLCCLFNWRTLKAGTDRYLTKLKQSGNL